MVQDFVHQQHGSTGDLYGIIQGLADALMLEDLENKCHPDTYRNLQSLSSLSFFWKMQGWRDNMLIPVKAFFAESSATSESFKWSRNLRWICSNFSSNRFYAMLSGLWLRSLCRPTRSPTDYSGWKWLWVKMKHIVSHWFYLRATAHAADASNSEEAVKG